MRLVFVRRAGKSDLLRIARADGTTERVERPKQRTLPHDTVPCVVEAGLSGGFLGLVAQGEATGLGAQAGLRSAGAEAAACLAATRQADAGSAPCSPTELRDVHASARSARDHAAQPVTAAAIDAMRTRMIELQIGGNARPIGGAMTLDHAAARA